MADGHGLVLGKFYPLHSGHQALIRTALRTCERVTVQVLASSVETIPLATRVDWIRQEHPTARVVGGLDDHPVDFDSASAWDVHMEVIQGLLPEPVDVVFTSDAYGEELARRLGARWHQVDAGRTSNAISGTAVRDDLARHWHELSPTVRQSLAQRIVLLGAESTGTTTLCEALAEHYGTVWVPEYGRTHSALRPGSLAEPWRSDEFDLVMDRQIERERDAARRTPRPLLICDTDALATTVWHERYVGPAPAHLVHRALEHAPLGYVLTGDEIPFVQDGLRDGEHLRHGMQDRFREVLSAQAVPWVEVHGPVAERVAAVVPFIDQLLDRALAIGPSLEQLAQEAP